MVAEKLRKYLDGKGIKYTTIKHSPAYTAQELAHAVHIPGKEIAKTVIVKAGDEMAMVVLPASKRVSLEALRDIAGTSNLRLAFEAEFRTMFPGCEVGAMPPFGLLYGIETYVDPSLAEDRVIAFNAGTHAEVIRMAWEDFEMLARPRIVAMSV